MNLLMSNFIYVFHPIDLHLLQNILRSKEFNNHLHILLLSLHICTMMPSFLPILAKSPHIIQFLMETSIMVHLLISFSTLYANLLVIHHTLGVIALKPFHLSWIFLIVQFYAPTSNTLLFIRYFYLVPITFPITIWLVYMLKCQLVLLLLIWEACLLLLLWVLFHCFCSLLPYLRGYLCN